MRPHTSQISLHSNKNSGVRISNIETVRSYSSQPKFKEGYVLNVVDGKQEALKKSGVYTVRANFIAKKIENPSTLTIRNFDQQKPSSDNLDKDSNLFNERVKFKRINSVLEPEDLIHLEKSESLHFGPISSSRTEHHQRAGQNALNLDSYRPSTQATTARQTVQARENNFLGNNESIVVAQNNENSEKIHNIFQEAAALQTISKESMTIQYKDGQLVPYSIVGKTDWFNNQQKREAAQSAALIPTLKNFPSKSNPSLFDNSMLMTDSKMANNSQQLGVNFQNNLLQIQVNERPSQVTNKSIIIHNNDISTVSINTNQKVNTQSSRVTSKSRTENSRKGNGTIHPKKESKYIEQEMTKEQLHREMELILQRLQSNNQKNEVFNKRMQNTLSKGEQLVMTKFERAAQNYNKTLEYWEKEIERVNRKIDRNSSESVVKQAQSFRNQMELLRKIELSEEDPQRFGERFYQMSLRAPMNPLLDPQIQVIQDLEGKYMGTQNAQELQQFEIIRRPQTHHSAQSLQNQAPFQSFQSKDEFNQKLDYQKKFFDKLNICEPLELDQLEIVGKNKFQIEAQVFLQDNSNHTSYQQLIIKQSNQEQSDFDDIIESKWVKKEIRRLDLIGPQELPQKY